MAGKKCCIQGSGDREQETRALHDERQCISMGILLQIITFQQFQNTCIERPGDVY